MNSMGRNGQISFEYLSNYMWGLIMVLIIVGTMTYFGMFNAERYTSPQCTFDSNFYCHDFALHRVDDTTFNMNLLLQNNMDSSITMNSSHLFDKDNNEVVCEKLDIYCRFDESEKFASASPSNSKVEIVDPLKEWTKTRVCRLEYHNCSMPLIAPEKERIKVMLNFSGVNSYTIHTTIGSVYSNIK